MTRSTTPWQIRSVVADAAGTATMTLAYETERRLRHNHCGRLDYDDSLVPGKIAVSIMHLGKVTDKEDNEIGLALRWSYGSVFGIWHGLLHRRLREPWASAIFGGHPDERDPVAVPAARTNAAALALAGRCDGHGDCDPCRVRRRRRDGR